MVSQVNALKIANQMNYQRSSYSYDGGAAPKFFGYSGVGYSKESGLAIVKANMLEFTPTVFVVPADQPTQKITFVNAAGEPEPPGAASNLQSVLEAVAVPDVTKIPGGALTQEPNTDANTVFLQPSTGKMWEFWRLKGVPGAYTCRYAGFTANMSQFLGVYPNNWGSRATSLCLLGGLITMQDLVDVMRGGKINHAIGVILPATGPGWVSPATRSDAGEGNYFSGIPEKHEGVANPAYPNTDAVPEGSMYGFHPESRASDYGLTGRLEAAGFEVIRVKGMVVIDGGGPTSSAPVTFNIESPLSLGSPYAYARVNPIAQAPFSTGTSYIPSSWADSSLPAITEQIHNEAPNIFSKLPWQTLEALEPFLP
jgi:hypothetical protein